jgi:hypothetical protein
LVRVIPVPQFELEGMTDFHFCNFRLTRLAPLMLHGAEAGMARTHA